MENKDEIIPYEKVFRELNKAGVDYLVCGGTAVVMLGFARTTIDLDLIVAMEKENLEKVYDVMASLGFKIAVPIGKDEFTDKETLARIGKEKNMKVASFNNPKNPFEIVDIGVNLPDIVRILGNKKFIQVEDLIIPVIFIKDLIKMKKDLARPKDIVDAQNLKEIQKYEKRKTKND